MVSSQPVNRQPASTSIKAEVMDKQYTYAEAALVLRVAESTLRRWVSEGRVPCHRAGRLVRFTEADLTAALKPSPATNTERPVRPAGRRQRR